MKTTAAAAADFSAARGGERGAWRVSGRGAALVFVHGVGLNKDAWRAQEAAFAAARKVVVYDLAGHGDALPPASSAPLIADYSAQLRGLLDLLGIARADVVGHSFGGFIALDFALRYANRVGRIAVLNGVFRRTAEARQAALARAADLLDEKTRPALIEKTLSRWFANAADSPLRSCVRGWLLENHPAAYAGAYRLFAGGDGAFVAALPRLAMPALFATGELDAHSTPQMSRRMAALAPRGRHRIIPGERHLAAMTAPDKVNAVLADFLAEGEA